MKEVRPRPGAALPRRKTEALMKHAENVELAAAS
jgi:hypothetical protein